MVRTMLVLSFSSAIALWVNHSLTLPYSVVWACGGSLGIFYFYSLTLPTTSV